METEERPDPEVQEPPVDPPPAPLEEPDKEPDGTDGLSVYGRKMNARAKKAEQETARLREENIRFQERLRVVEESKKAAPADKVYTAEEVQGFVDAGQLKPSIAAAYLARMEVQAALRENDEKQKREAPIVQARSRIAEYVKAIPGLADLDSEEYAKAASEYTELITQGYPDNDQTRALAIKVAHGDLSTIQKKAAMRDMNRNPRTMPIDGSGGASNGNKQGDISHAPAHLQEYWKKAALKPEEQKRHFERWQAQQKK